MYRNLDISSYSPDDWKQKHRPVFTDRIRALNPKAGMGSVGVNLLPLLQLSQETAYKRNLNVWTCQHNKPQHASAVVFVCLLVNSHILYVPPCIIKVSQECFSSNAV